MRVKSKFKRREPQYPSSPLIDISSLKFLGQTEDSTISTERIEKLVENDSNFVKQCFSDECLVKILKNERLNEIQTLNRKKDENDKKPVRLQTTPKGKNTTSSFSLLSVAECIRRIELLKECFTSSNLNVFDSFSNVLCTRPKHAYEDNILEHPIENVNFSFMDNNNKDGKNINEGEIILNISIYSSARPQTKQYEYKFLGQQCLSSIKSAFYCPSDYIDENCRNSRQQTFLFIENVFYVNGNVDNYDDSCLDFYCDEYLRNIQAMENVKFKNMKVRINYPYLLVHGERCEHILMFSEIRAFHKDIDRPSVDSYPILTFMSYNPWPKCLTCDIKGAKKIIMNDEMSGEKIALYCDSCFEEFFGSFDINEIAYGVENEEATKMTIYDYAPGVPIKELIRNL